MSDRGWTPHPVIGPRTVEPEIIRSSMISNLQRLVDGYLAGLPDERLLPAMRKTKTVIDVPIAGFDF
jgi:hypothetical protein